LTQSTVAPLRRALPAAERQLAGFADLVEQARDPFEPEWVRALREAGADFFADVGLPTARDEEWRFTPLRGLATIPFTVAAAAPALTRDDLAPFLLGRDWPTIVLVNGRYAPELSSAAPGEVVFSSLRDAVRRTDATLRTVLGHDANPRSSAFAAVNAALFTDGVWIDVPVGAHVAHPLHIVHLVAGAADQTIVAPRVAVRAGRGSRCMVIESYVHLTRADAAAPQYLTAAVTEIALDEDARVEHIRIQHEASAAWHVGTTAVAQQARSHYRAFTLDLGGKLSRHDLRTRHHGSGVETLLYGVYLGHDAQLIDNHTAIHHDHPNCNSWEVYKGVLTDASHAVFNGKVLVKPEAQKTDAKQTNRNLLLSDRARVDTKPQLEIFADDVKCTHGATVGRLDEQQRYYLQTRGIAGRLAQVLLITAFVGEVLAEVTEPQVRAQLDALVHARLETMIA
jgi:Fe-S cluster assembly protein SufD